MRKVLARNRRRASLQLSSSNRTVRVYRLPLIAPLPLGPGGGGERKRRHLNFSYNVRTSREFCKGRYQRISVAVSRNRPKAVKCLERRTISSTGLPLCV